MEIKTINKEPFIGPLTSELFIKKETNSLDIIWSNVLCSYLNDLSSATIDISVNDKTKQVFVNQGFVFKEQDLPYLKEHLDIFWNTNNEKVLELIQKEFSKYGLNEEMLLNQFYNKLLNEFKSIEFEGLNKSWYCSKVIWDFGYKSKSPEVIKAQLLKKLHENGIEVRYKKIWHWTEKYQIYLKWGSV